MPALRFEPLSTARAKLSTQNHTRPCAGFLALLLHIKKIVGCKNSPEGFLVSGTEAVFSLHVCIPLFFKTLNSNLSTHVPSYFIPPKHKST